MLRVKSVEAREASWVSERPADEGQRVLARIARGDRKALAELYDNHQTAILRYLLSLTDDRGQAEEILQDTLLAVWKGAASFEGRSTVLTWVIGIARRQAHNTLRRRSLPRVDLAEIESLPDSRPELEDAVIATAERAELTDAIRQLAPIHREILNLTFTLELSYAEMATLLEVPEGTIKSRLSNAKSALRARLYASEEVER
jgi:RNA polymerase sigma factor (sigma-70 family)